MPAKKQPYGKAGTGIKDCVRRQASALRAIGRALHAEPEIGFQEHRAVQRVVAFLREQGYRVEHPWVGLKTSFRATLTGRTPRGPCLGVLAEYDALDGLGHACGHNLITVAALSAAVGMAGTRAHWRGRFEIIGTPAEELFAGKGIMADRHAFDHLDACWMTHPSTFNRPIAGANALETLVVQFRGKAAHAAVCPWDGINALDAAVLFINALNAWRQHLHEDARLHAVVRDGGKAVNVIPEQAVVEVVVRSSSEARLDALCRQVRRAARGAGLALGAGVSIRPVKPGYRSFRINAALETVMTEAYNMAGIVFETAKGNETRGSLDMGNVSQIVPASHPFFGIVPAGHTVAALHTRDFMKLANTDYAYQQAMKAGIGMALAAVRLSTDTGAFQAVKQEARRNPGTGRR
ncbi:MAG: hypothetical protein A2498_08895 [Lentisphaerae bacterium RIFOXYC12_FULL_60_16]|nr:MAG: hypothetical protein A2498_08895 [Lentisphaerae bacterium RIFOXYC12_FULL_60_16]OGV70168.1 MAG: hypothetical protein A2269_02600 [Lentisphaerae bacterium RIFOXYA12_FULL_60_10]OGV81039.1 MAG: hypothetical protein A2340_07260 [Lentisphaerae bacterium RIFOXYB12_FULL_60_10]